MTTGNNNDRAPQGDFSIDQDEFGTIVRVNVGKLRDLSRVPGIKAVYPTDPDPDQPHRHHGVISNMKDLNGDGVPEILVFAVGTDLDPAWSVWNGKGERLFAMSFLPAPQRCHASQCGPGLGFDGFTDLDGNGKADILVAYGRWKTGDPQYHFIAEGER
jgi:hypothetical protein